MAAVRGRKRTEDPTPNRARDIQRAFRARRAAHLESLEERILELEDENNYFRALLNLAPANRPALGKGPTGRGLAKSRSRITVDTDFNSHSSSPDPSDSPRTPKMECPIPVQPGDSFPGAMAHDSNGVSDVDAFAFQQSQQNQANKIMDSGLVDQFAYGNNAMSGLPAEFESVRLGQDIPIVDATMDLSQGAVFPDYTWGPVPQLGDMQMPANPRAFGYTQQTAATSMVPRAAVPPHMRSMHGHRRSNTEPQSLGSLVATFNPGHRSTSSEIGAFAGTPSPPPLPIRATYPVYQ